LEVDLNRLFVCLVAVLMLVPALASAQIYKCKRADGSVGFQSDPCPAGTAGSAISVVPASGYYSGAPETSNATRKDGAQRAMRALPPAQPNAQDAASRRAEEETRARNEEIAAHNKALRCNSARQQLGILREARPVYSRDNEGKRVYLEDSNRQAEISAAQQRVAAECS
jgi:Domain of unknown function (DUF4124)